MRNIALEGKITIIKTLALSKTVYLTLIQIQKNQKNLHLEQLDSQNQT